MVLFPYAKINLGLQVVEKRHDGFHNIISGLYPIGWSDVLEVLEADELFFKTTGLEVPGNLNDNLCIKAYKLMQELYDIPPVYLHLHKVIPMGAGLGGGSSDAAFTLKGLKEFFELPISDSEIKEMAAELGSDCAFFIEGTPALATGKGDQLESIETALPPGYLLVVTPPVQVNTVAAYNMLIPKNPSVDLKTALTKPLSQWPGLVTNDFEAPVFEKYPLIAQVKETLQHKGAIYASLSGSGSSVFGIFEKEPDFKGWFGADHIVWGQQL